MTKKSTRLSPSLFFLDKILMVTGGTGSFGKSITRELLKCDPAEIRIYSRSEDKQNAMQYEFRKHTNISYILGDVRDSLQLMRAMRETEYVFHAAAQKQVPATEYAVLEGVKTNVLGAQNVIDAAIQNDVKKVIAISTDKAVEPVNAMGMTKALQEKLFIQANAYPNASKTIFSCVRYGNVLGSTGSVLPLFLKQIKYGDPMTVTDREMTRFLITLDQTVDLVFAAMMYAVGGEIFVPNMKAHTIYDLALTLQEIFAGIGTSSNIEISGIRVGEKLHETLIHPTDSLRTIKQETYYVTLPEILIPQIPNHYASSKTKKLFRYSSDTAARLTKAELKKIITETRLIEGL